KVLEHVGSNYHIEPLRTELMCEIDHIQVGDNDPMTEPHRFTRRSRIDFYTDDRAAELLDENLRHAPRRAADLEYSLPRAHAPDYPRVSVVDAKIDPLIVFVRSHHV